MVTENRLLVRVLGLATTLAATATVQGAGAAWKPGDMVPESKTLSIEGIPVSLRPPEGKLLLVLVDDLGASDSTERVKAGIKLFRRFHSKGLNAVGVLSGSSTDHVLRAALRWQIPFPLIMPSKSESKPSGAVEGFAGPAGYLVDDQGKIVATGLEGDKAHETVAKLLKVSMQSVPMPPEPEDRKEAVRVNPVDVLSTVEDWESGVESKYTAVMGDAKERKAAEPCKKNLRQISLALTDYREDHNGELPERLSDLFPRYLQDDKVLICPINPEMPKGEGFEHRAETRMKCNYLYEFAPEPRSRKKQQLELYGDKVPVVRCVHHGRPMSLSYGGEIYFSELGWEESLPDHQTLDSREAKVRRQLRIIAAAMARYHKAKGEMPNELADLYPEYLKDKSQLTCTVTKQAFAYRFSPEGGGGKAGRELKLQEAKDPNYGAYVPVIRVKDVCEGGNLINLGYGGEIYTSSDRWEELFR